MCSKMWGYGLIVYIRDGLRFLLGAKITINVFL